MLKHILSHFENLEKRGQSREIQRAQKHTKFYHVGVEQGAGLLQEDGRVDCLDSVDGLTPAMEIGLLREELDRSTV